MTDTFKEFYSGSPTYAQLVTGVNIASPGANAQHVVKEVLLRSSAMRNFALYVDTVRVIDWVGTGLLADGVEIVPANKNLVLKTASLALATGISQFATTTQWRTIQTPAIFNDDQQNSSDSYTAANTTVTATTVTADALFIADDGDVYYTSRGTATVYKRDGGPTGAQTALSSVQAGPKVWDGAGKIVSLSATTITVLDTATDAITNVTISGGAPNGYSANYSRICAMDGYLFHYGNAVTTIDVYNIATGARVTQIPGVTAVATSYFGFEVNKDFDGNYILLAIPAATSILTVNLGPSLANPLSSVRINTVPTHGMAPATTGASNRLFKRVDVPGVVLGFGTNDIVIFDLVGGQVLKTVGGAVSALTADNYWPTLDLTLAGNAFGTVTARAVGVEVT